MSSALGGRLRPALTALSLTAVVLLSVPAFADEYSFKVTNNTDTKITKILVSEDGEEYGFFKIQMHKDNLAIETDCSGAIPSVKKPHAEEELFIQ